MSVLQEAKVPDIGGSKGVPVIEVLIKVGDTVKKDQGLITLESDKATMEVPAPFAGVVRELRVKLGDEMSEGDVVAMIEISGDAAAPPTVATESTTESTIVEAAPKKEEPVLAAPVAAEPAPIVEPVPANNPVRTPPVSFDADGLMPANVPYASPSVRVFARELGVDL